MRKGRGKGMGSRGRFDGLGRGKGNGRGRYGNAAKIIFGSSTETNMHTPYLKETDAPLIHEQELETHVKKSKEAVEDINIIEKRIGGAERAANIPSMVASINQKECTGCGICQDVCITEALIVDEAAKVDTKKCKGCGACVAECPNDAISLRKT